MKNKSTRRQFIRKISKAIFTTTLTFSLLKYGNSFASSLLSKDDNKKQPLINPAFRINLYQDGSIELYTFNSERKKKSTTHNGLEAEILLKIMSKKDPWIFSSELGTKYELKEKEYVARVNEIIESFEEKGFIYYGEIMKVKITNKQNG